MTRMVPLAKTMALGGVAERERVYIGRECHRKHFYHLPIGNINANETANVQGRMRNAGCMPEERAYIK